MPIPRSAPQWVTAHRPALPDRAPDRERHRRRAPKVTDVGPGLPTTPTGRVKLRGTKTDTFTGNPCTLAGSGASASCKVTLTPTEAETAAGKQQINVATL